MARPGGVKIADLLKRRSVKPSGHTKTFRLVERDVRSIENLIMHGGVQLRPSDRLILNKLQKELIDGQVEPESAKEVLHLRKRCGMR